MAAIVSRRNKNRYLTLAPGDEDRLAQLCKDYSDERSRVGGEAASASSSAQKEEADIYCHVHNDVGLPDKLGRILATVGEHLGPKISVFSIGDGEDGYPSWAFSGEDMAKFFSFTTKLQKVRLEACSEIDGKALSALSLSSGDTLEELRVGGTPTRPAERLSEGEIKTIFGGEGKRTYFPKLRKLELLDLGFFCRETVDFFDKKALEIELVEKSSGILEEVSIKTTRMVLGGNCRTGHEWKRVDEDEDWDLM